MSDPARDYSLSPPPQKPTVEEFRAFVAMRLTAATKAIPNTVPTGMLDERVQALLDELSAIEEYLYELDLEERKRDDAEHTRERKVAAKRRDPTIEEVVTHIDHHVQKAVEILGMPGHRAPFLDLITVTQLLRSVTRLLDKFPREAFSERGSTAGNDPRIAALIAVLHAHHRGEPTS